MSDLKVHSERYYIAPDTEYDSGLYCVFDSQEHNEFNQDKCVLTYVPKTIAQQTCNQLNTEKETKQ